MITSKAFVATWQTAVKAAATSGSAGDEDGGTLAASAVAWAMEVATTTAVVIRSCASCLSAHTTSSTSGCAMYFQLCNIHAATLVLTNLLVHL